MESVAIYTRLSRDETGVQTATARQEAACRAFAASRDWSVGAVFEDVDVSAYRKQPRPGFELLRDAVSSGRIGGVLVWKLDRLVRRPAEFETFWDLCERRHVFLASTTEPIDTSTDLGLTIVRMLVAFAHMESATMSLRMRARERDSALRGQPRIRSKAFGYTRDMSAVVEEEAALIHEAAQRVLAGESLRSVAFDWTDRGIPTLRGAQEWTMQTIRQILLSPRVIAKRQYRGEIVADGKWPPILDELTAARVREVLCDPARRAAPRWRSESLLSQGLARCGRCGRNLKTGVRGSGRRIYVCATRPEGCGRISIGADALDGYVVGRVLDRIERDGSVSVNPLSEADELSSLRELATLDASMALARRDFYVEQQMARDEYLMVHQQITQRRERLRVDLGLRRAITFDERTVRGDWQNWPIARRRTVLRSVLDFVDVGPAQTTGGLDADRSAAMRASLNWLGADAG